MGADSTFTGGFTTGEAEAITGSASSELGSYGAGFEEAE